MTCIICHNPSDNAICLDCAGLEPQEVIKTYCLAAASKSPLQMAQGIMGHPGFPVAGHLHHALVAAVLVAAYRNAGGEVSPEKLDEAIKRGTGIPGGFCAGYGADAAAIACGIAVSLINGNTINAEHATGRARAHALTGEAMLLIANNSGNRCCKRSVYGVLELATNYFNRTMGVSLEVAQKRVICPFTAKNKLCNGQACKYYPDSV